MSTTVDRHYQGECIDCEHKINITLTITTNQRSTPAVWARCRECEAITVVHLQ